MTYLSLTPQERDSRTLEDAKVAEAEKAIREDGFVVLEDVVEHDHLDVLWGRMVEDLEVILARPDVPHQFVWGNVQQDPPPVAPYVFEDVIENPWVKQITRRVLGDDAYNRFYSGNTNLPDSKLQPVHVDNGDLWRGLEVPHPAYQLVVNLALKDVDERNGSIELWPGSHLLMSNVVGEDIKVDPDLLERRRVKVPPIRGNTKKGSFLIRDMRIWHRGTPNTSKLPRFMIAMTHCASFLARRRPLRFHPNVSSVFADEPVSDYILTDEDIPYLSGHNAYDFPTQGVILPL